MPVYSEPVAHKACNKQFFVYVCYAPNSVAALQMHAWSTQRFTDYCVRTKMDKLDF